MEYNKLDNNIENIGDDKREQFGSRIGMILATVGFVA